MNTIAVGSKIEPVEHTPTTIGLFRFSAATWNAHRIHFDTEYARSEGYPDVLVQSHLHGCFLLDAARAWAGPDAELRSFRWENRGIAVPGDTLTISGDVSASTVANGKLLVTLDLESRKQDGSLCAPGRVVLALPIQNDTTASGDLS